MGLWVPLPHYLYVLLEPQVLEGLEEGSGARFGLAHDREVLYLWAELKICVHLVSDQPETGIIFKFAAPINSTLTFNPFPKEKGWMQSLRFVCASVLPPGDT